ncbi:binding-protein-dependent transport systems inner membrane component [Paenibacillus curdlanolyticus YK9]|uniref:Binding-protein-dependent transport systems inner membrane component n=1 Tax=Paenibacillus curdlanolyticus YK9 TaxID=717606 RepID=E0I733_9BACL|nr:ABC transporter permease [Paenibacillus curdlanolyticus]EFM11849.1 binding-protein-dependent transport systems inner membrane component [Paenibacillus curdlanolyticus YK9]
MSNQSEAVVRHRDSISQDSVSHAASAAPPAISPVPAPRDKRVVDEKASGRSNRSVVTDAALGALLPVIALAVWQLAGERGWISPTFLPTPIAIAEAFGKLLLSGELLRHLGVSIGRAATGFAIGGSLGLLLGLVTGLFRRAEYLLDPSLQLLRLVPHLAIAPLIILWFGFGEVSKVVIIMTGAFFPLYINTFLGIRNVDARLFEVARVLQFSWRTRITKLIVPAALPELFIGLRLSLAVAWIGLVVAELIGATSGVGFLINLAKQESDTSTIFVGILIFAIVGKLIDSLVRLLERKWLFWRDSYQG